LVAGKSLYTSIGLSRWRIPVLGVISARRSHVRLTKSTTRWTSIVALSRSGKLPTAISYGRIAMVCPPIRHVNA
jgi:hypothetical protein